MAKKKRRGGKRGAGTKNRPRAVSRAKRVKHRGNNRQRERKRVARPTRKTPRKSNRKAVRRPKKPVRRIRKPVRKRGRERELQKELGRARERIRKLEDAVRDRRQSAGYGEDAGEPDRPVRQQRDSDIEFDSLPEFIEGAEYDDIDWTEFDWDDVYDDVGDEDEDLYGEES